MAKRKGLSKRVRFAVFARDGFRCRYCGRQSDEVTLVVDHLLPVAAGGTDDPENLVTSCEPCNQGKAAIVLSEQPPEDPLAELARQQELREQERLAEVARRAFEARQELRQMVVDFWCDTRGTWQADRHTIDVVLSYVRRHGFGIVSDWIAHANATLPSWESDAEVGRYISGIRRSMIEEGQL